MPPPGFQSRVNSSVVRLTARQGGSTAAAIAEGVAQLGQVGSAIVKQDGQVQERIADSELRIAELERRRQISAHTADRLGAWGQLQADIGNAVMDIRTRSRPGAVGHKEEVIKYMREAMDGFRGTLADEPEVLERFEPMLEEYEARALLNEGEWELQRRAKHQGDSWASYVETSANALTLDPSPARFEQILTDAADALDLMDVDGTAKAALQQSLRASVSNAFIEGKMQRGEVGDVEALVRSGFFNDSGVDVNKTLNRVENEKRAMAVAQEQAAADERTSAREAIKAVEEKVRLGINPAADEIAAVRQSAMAAGLPEADIIALDGLGIQMGINRQYSEAADPTGARASAAVSRLSIKIANGTASEAEQVSYAQLQSIAEARGKKAGAALRELVSQGPQGRMAALQQLQALPRSQRIIAGQEAGDGLGYLSLLPEHTQRYAIDGGEVRKARKDEFGKDDQVKAAFKQQLGGVAASLGGGYDDILNVAWDIYAGTMNGKRRTGWDAAHFNTAVRIAFGATKRPNGVLQGGLAKVRGQSVVLPEWKTASEFDQSLSRLTFKGAVYADGSAASKADILNSYRPELYEEGDDGRALYRFIDVVGKPLRHKDGSVYNIVVVR